LVYKVYLHQHPLLVRHPRPHQGHRHHHRQITAGEGHQDPFLDHLHDRLHDQFHDRLIAQLHGANQKVCETINRRQSCVKSLKSAFKVYHQTWYTRQWVSYKAKVLKTKASKTAFKRSSGMVSLKPPFFARQIGVRRALRMTISSGFLLPILPSEAVG